MKAKDVLAEQKYDEACYAMWKAERNKAELALIKDINTNGMYIKGRFGEDQRFYYNISNASLQGSRVMVNLESITVFLGDGRSVVKPGDIRIEKRVKEYTDMDNIGIEMYHRTTKKDYDEVGDYLVRIAKYWEDIKKI